MRVVGSPIFGEKVRHGIDQVPRVRRGGVEQGEGVRPLWLPAGRAGPGGGARRRPLPRGLEEAGSMPLFLLIYSFDEKCSSSFGPIGASGGAGAMALIHRRMPDLPFTAYEALKREEAERVEERLKEIDAGVVVTIEPTGLEYSEERRPRCGSTETMGPWTVLFEGAGLRITAGDQKLCMQGRCACCGHAWFPRGR